MTKDNDNDRIIILQSLIAILREGNGNIESIRKIAKLYAVTDSERNDIEVAYREGLETQTKANAAEHNANPNMEHSPTALEAAEAFFNDKELKQAINYLGQLIDEQENDKNKTLTQKDVNYLQDTFRKKKPQAQQILGNLIVCKHELENEKKAQGALSPIKEKELLLIKVQVEKAKACLNLCDLAGECKEGQRLNTDIKEENKLFQDLSDLYESNRNIDVEEDKDQLKVLGDKFSNILERKSNIEEKSINSNDVEKDAMPFSNLFESNSFNKADRNQDNSFSEDTMGIKSIEEETVKVENKETNTNKIQEQVNPGVEKNSLSNDKISQIAAENTSNPSLNTKEWEALWDKVENIKERSEEPKLSPAVIKEAQILFDKILNPSFDNNDDPSKNPPPQKNKPGQGQGK